jgi:hypothetical protein
MTGKDLDENKDYLNSNEEKASSRIISSYSDNEKGGISFFPKVPQNQDEFEEQFYNIYFDSWGPPRGIIETFFSNSTILDTFVGEYLSESVTISENEKPKMESFIFDQLGFTHDYSINWESHLIKAMILFSRYKNESEG